MPQGECCPAVFLCLKLRPQGSNFLRPFCAYKMDIINEFGYKGKKVIVMTLNIFFISITLKKRKESLQQATRNEMVEKLFEQNKERQLSVYHLL